MSITTKLEEIGKSFSYQDSDKYFGKIDAVFAAETDEAILDFLSNRAGLLKGTQAVVPFYSWLSMCNSGSQINRVLNLAASNNG